MLDFGFYNMDCMQGMKEFPDKFFDIAIVDPPYGGITQGGYMRNQMGGGIARNKTYNLALWEQGKPPKEYFDELKRVSKNQIIWGGNYFTTLIGHDSQCWVAWDKERPEEISFTSVELAYTSFDRASEIFHYKWNGMLQGDMKNKEFKIHPTQKPVRLYEWLVNKFCNPDDIILDTHVGSASSLIAYHRTNHKYIGFEIDPNYYAAAKRRLDDETAQISMFDLGFNPYQE